MTSTKKSTQKTKKDSSFILNLTLKSTDLKKEYQKYLLEIQKNFESKGFRKGKAPLDVVEKNISQDKVIQEISSHLISHLYSDEIKKQKLNPIIQPKVNVLNPPLTIDKDWQIEITACEKPELTLDPKYKAAVKKINAQKEDKDSKNNKKLDAIFEKLVSLSKVNLPDILVEADLNAHLNSVFEQLQKSNKTFESYLKDKKLTFEQYQDEIKKQIEKEWTLNLIIDHIAKVEKIDIKEEDVKAVVNSNPQLAQNVNMVYYLLQQQNVVKYLQSL